jgi:hypothetical protein
MERNSFQSQLDNLITKVLDSFIFWGKPFVIKDAFYHLKIIILFVAFFLIFYALDIVLESFIIIKIFPSILAVLTSMIITRHLSNLLMILVPPLIIFIMINSIFNNYSVYDFFSDYKDFTEAINPVDSFLSMNNSSFEIDNLMLRNLERSDEMREFSLLTATSSLDFLYKEFGSPVRFMSTYIFILDKWRYVTEQGEYIYKPAFQLSLFEKNGYFAGNSNDFVIFLASAFECIGSEKIRFIKNDDYIFMELLILHKDDLNAFRTLISMLYQIDEGNIYYTKDESGYWINFDFGNHPGFKYLNDDIILPSIAGK